MDTQVLPDAGALAARVAEEVAAAIAGAVTARGVACVAFSGGSTPARMLRLLAVADVAWRRVVVFQVDERVAPDGRDDRNATMLRRELLDHVPAEALLMPVTADDLDGASDGYAAALRDRCDGVLDLVHLGIGADGHTASLVPGDPVLGRTDTDVALTGSYQGRRRMTLTYPPLDRARQRVFEVAGAGKEAATAALAAGDTAIPAGRVRRDGSLLLCDALAARDLPER